MTDPIADMFTRIRNAQAVSKESVEMPSSSVKVALAKLLERSGFIKSTEMVKRKTRNVIKIQLKYQDGSPAISTIKRISKPGQRMYIASQDIRRVRGGYGFMIVSTSRGIMSGKEARKQGIGGEIIGEVW